MEDPLKHPENHESPPDELPVDEQEILKIVERALLQNDLLRASAALNKLKENASPACLELCQQVNARLMELEKIERLFDEATRNLEQGNLDDALGKFSEVLNLCPDHVKARTGLQEATKKKDASDRQTQCVSEAKTAFASGDFITAKDRCVEILNSLPDHLETRQMLDEIEHWMTKNRQVWHLVQQGERLFTDQKFEEAISVWESITDIDPAFREGVPLIEKAKKVISSRDNEETARTILRDAQRAFDNKDFSMALKILGMFPEGTSRSVDATLLFRKAKDSAETEMMQKEFEQKIREFINTNELEKARSVYQLLLQLAPDSKLIDELRDVFK